MKGSKRSSSSLNDLRLVVLNVIYFITIFLLIFYLFFLQIVKGMEFKKKATEVALREIPIPAQRGLIYDRHYDVPLVYNIDSFAVYLIPGSVENEKLETLFQNMASVLKMELSEIKGKVRPSYYNRYQPIEIKSGVSFKTISYIAEHITDFPGINWNSKPIRGYYETGSIAHIIGYVGDITTEELNVLYNEGYNYASTIGKSGIEKQYDTVLKGLDGKRFKIVDVKEKQLRRQVPDEIPPEPGKRLILTIDKKIQQLSEKSLGDRIGSVVVLKPATGEVLSLVSYPWFNPNIFYSENGTKIYRELSTDPKFPFLNRTIQSAYPPASVFKIIMSAAFIEEDLFSVFRNINCTGEYILGDRTARCWNHFGHGKVDFFEAFQESCNVYFYTLGHKYLKVDNIVRYAREFGIGIKTGIDLPQEVGGFLPTPDWKENYKNTLWYEGDTLNLSIGQGWATATPLQLANAIAMIANEGVIYKPHVVKEVRDPISGDLIKGTEPEVLHKSRMHTATFKKVKEAMRRVVTDGTGKLISTKVVEVAGKTGTPETGVAERYHSWFASYGPYETENPEDMVVVVAMMEASDSEEQWWASKTVNIIFQGIFADQTYEESMVALYPWLRNQFGGN